jgi:hypothetical protein
MKTKFALASFLVLASVSAYAANVSVSQGVKRGKEAISREFKDPNSVQWKDIFLNRTTQGEYALCGHLNAKNSYGAYVGFRGFYTVVDMQKDEGEARLAEARRMLEQSKQNLENFGKNAPNASDHGIEGDDGFSEGAARYCAEGKRTYAK